jgi:hypothetical protein
MLIRAIPAIDEVDIHRLISWLFCTLRGILFVAFFVKTDAIYQAE